MFLHGGSFQSAFQYSVFECYMCCAKFSTLDMFFGNWLSIY
ncbi:MAG: hypothetical protein P857_791 [Candidatus Xenolissoclinum pacificiensis L6]|uniref:Uncharacterized protein n=1 Tax=Candidatus Xenolissoclinum pacificiensis L6 TaxID=1401685 RepID=W2V1T7_9RICK|nr:MAG: hypothetical protein P857_791 [Candidatus Xenolissoclinum pacificiensis L6]